MKSSSRMILTEVLIIVAVLLIGGIGAYFWNQSYNYVSTDDASVNAPTVTVAAMANGNVSSLDVKTGQHVTKGSVIGTETIAPTTAKTAASTVNIVAPVSGNIATISVHAGQAVAAGTPILTEVELNHVDIVANIPESEIRNITVGQTATITVDAHPGVSFSGHVTQIEPATQSFFSLVPTAASA
ncbi:MAG: efflux RND transporter periplasmic adaptor subunit, partial [Firmicutes bacterium]|nr:efflux RND transporter periplasmic adaptor subunit [Bacillota bacterium]